MRLKFKSIFSTTTICLPLALLLAASAGRAQNPEGKFTLPYRVHLGSAVLAPGKYSFTVLSLSESTCTLSVRGNGAWRYVLTSATRVGPVSGHSHLSIVTIGEERFVHSMTLKEANLEFRFLLPRKGKGERRFTPLSVSRQRQAS